MSGAVRFPNLNALRFFAALAVIVAHVEYKKRLFGLPSAWDESYFISTISYHAVTFFFVLSGFLITFLLLRERQVTGQISIGKFYLRRVLRIAPVYYLTILVAFFVFPLLPFGRLPGQTESLLANFWPAFLFSVFFLSNYVLARFSNLACVDQTWSVSTEEQFYLFWPLVISFFRARWLPALFIAVAVVGVVLRYSVGNSAGGTVKTLLYLNRFGCMAIGGLAALLVLDRSNRMFLLLTKPLTFYLAAALIGWLLAFKVFPGNASGLQAEAYSILFAILIVNFAVGSAKKVPLDGFLLRRAGDYSYAAYMLHNFVIVMVCNLAIWAGGAKFGALGLNLLVYPVILGGTFLASGLSYHFLERPILRLKTRFSVVESSA